MEEEELSILDAKMASEPTFGGPEAACGFFAFRVHASQRVKKRKRDAAKANTNSHDHTTTTAESPDYE